MTAPTIDPEDIFALLEDGPKSTGQLALWLKQPSPRVFWTLKRLARAGFVIVVGESRLWSLPLDGASRAATPSPPPPRRAPDVRDGVPEVDDEAEVDPDAEAAEAFLAPPRRGRPALRQTPLDQNTRGNSWWVGLSRDELRQRAAERQTTMATAREARWVDGGVRQ